MIGANRIPLGFDFSWIKFDRGCGALNGALHGAKRILPDVELVPTTKQVNKAHIRMTERETRPGFDSFATHLSGPQEGGSRILPVLQLVLRHVCSQKTGTCMRHGIA